MYECKCCCVTICPECICAAKLITASLIKLDSALRPAGSVEAQQSLPRALAGQISSEPVAGRPATTASIRVRRKPIAGAVAGGVGGNPGIALQNAESPIPSDIRSSFPTTSNVSQSASRSWTVQDPQSGYQTFSGPTTIGVPGTTAVQQAIHSPVRPGVVPHAQTEPMMQSRNVSSQPIQQPRPQLQHIRTAPQLAPNTAFVPQIRRQSATQPRSAHSQPVPPSNNRRSSLFSMANAKKLSHNKWVRSGAKFGANLVLNAVVGDIASGLLNSNSNNNNNNDSSNNDDSNTTGDNTNGADYDAGDSEPQDSVPDPNPVDQDTGGDTTPDYSNVDANLVAQSDDYGYQYDTTYTDPSQVGQIDYPNYQYDTSYTDSSQVLQPDYSTYQYDTSYTDPSQGGQDATDQYDDAQQQLYNAQAGLQDAENNQSQALDNSATDEINASNAFVGDEEVNANNDLSWGSDAVLT